MTIANEKTLDMTDPQNRAALIVRYFARNEDRLDIPKNWDHAFDAKSDLLRDGPWEEAPNIYAPSGNLTEATKARIKQFIREERFPITRKEWVRIEHMLEDAETREREFYGAQ